MATVTVSTNIAGNVKPTFGTSSATGLTVRANGEEKISVLDTAGNIVDAQIPVPFFAPVVAQTRTVTIATNTTPSTHIFVTSGTISASDVGKIISSAASGFPVGVVTIASVNVGAQTLELSAPTTAAGTTGNAATIGSTATGLVANQYAAWAYVYAATTRYPFVENDISINGSLAPRSNPSPATSVLTNGSGTALNIATQQVARLDIDQIWFFRTEFFTAQVDADLNAKAGNLFFVGAVVNDPTKAGTYVNFADSNPVSTGDQVEVDNFGVPCFQFVTYEDPFWWGWGNFPFTSTASWATNGIVTLTDASKKWFDGRNGQYVRLSGVSSGGRDGIGGFIFKWLSPTTAQLTTDGTVAATLSASGTGTVVVQGPATTLYRSKRRNPFSWGYTQYLGNNLRVPQVYAFKVGGGQGTAIGIIPAIERLLLSTEYPAGSYILDLKLAYDVSGNFFSSLTKLSDFYSISAHFSQFAATKNFTLIRALPDERIVLWGWDAKNYVILECDGFKINPISQKIQTTLRNMSQDRSRQILAHGAYDARNKLNCMWLPTANTGMLVNFLVAQHGPTGEWFMLDDHDVLCSAGFQDGETALNKIYVGTQSGLVGEAFSEGHFSDWQVNPNSSGVISAATDKTLNRNDGGIFNLADLGYVGSWCLVTDPDGNNEQWARISGLSQTTLSFDFVYSKIGGGTSAFNPIPEAGWLFYVGLIEIKAVKYFDFNAPSTDKKLSEVWLMLDGVDVSPLTTPSTFIRAFEELSLTPDSPKNDGLITIPITQGTLDDGTPSMAWVSRNPPSSRLKSFGIQIIDRGYKQWRLYNFTLRAQ